MAHEITMPKLSDTMTEGRLVSWKKVVGERIERGDIIAEVETDKANMELEAFASGTLLKTLVNPGEIAPVGEVIAVIGEEGEVSGKPVEKPVPPQPEPEKPHPPPAEPEKTGQKPEEAGKIEEEKASPMVRRLAREKGIELGQVAGSGPEGRILREDLELFLKERQAQFEVKVKENLPKSIAKPEPEPQPGPEPSQLPPSGESRQLSRMRAAIGRTVTRAWQEIPHFAVTVAIDMGAAEEVRRELKESGTPVTVNDMIVKAAAIALRKHPQVNNSFTGDRIIVNSDINIGLIVSLEDGLLIPVIRECQGLTLQEIGSKSRELIELAMSGKISEVELSGGTFTISNMGMFGVEEFMAIIHPSQGAILAVGAVRDEAVVKNGSVIAGRTMRVTLSADHRLMDGAYAARFLQELKRALENPVALLV